MILLRLIALFWKPIAALLGVGALYLKGRADARQKAKLQAQKQYIETSKRMDNADEALPDDSNMLRDWLQHRDPNKR